MNRSLKRPSPSRPRTQTTNDADPETVRGWPCDGPTASPLPVCGEHLSLYNGERSSRVSDRVRGPFQDGAHPETPVTRTATAVSASPRTAGRGGRNGSARPKRSPTGAARFRQKKSRPEGRPKSGRKRQGEQRDRCTSLGNPCLIPNGLTNG